MLTGVHTAVVTPFDGESGINTSALIGLIEHIVAGGGQGLIALGTAGEAYACSEAERQVVLETIAKAGAGRAELMAGVTASSTAEVIRNIEAAGRAGYSTMMIAPPPYALPSARDLIEHYTAIAASTEAAIVLYDFPARVGVSVSLEVLAGLESVEQIIGIKEASGDLKRVVAIRERFGDRYELVCGCDSLIRDFAIWGSKSWIAGGSNFLPAEHERLLAAAVTGDDATTTELLDKLLPLFLEFEGGGYIPKLRACCESFGLPVGLARAPLGELNDEERRAIERCLDGLRARPAAVS